MNKYDQEAEAIIERRHVRRLANEDRYLARLERDERKAAPMIGELASGKFYVYPVGGRYFESCSYCGCVAHLKRNGYLR